MRKTPPMRALECFEQAAHHESFSAAAAAIGMTHGAISHQVRALELWLGTKVFERHAGGVRLTEDGQRLSRACRVAFSIIEEECGRMRGAADRLLRIGCSATFLSHWLLPRAEAFSSASKGTQLSFQTQADLHALETGRVDVVIISTADEPPKDVCRRQLGTDRIGPVCAVDWSPMPGTPAEFARLPLLHARSRPSAWAEWSAAVGVRLERNRSSQFDSLALTIEAARGGLGFAMTPKFLVRDDVAKGRLAAPLGFADVNRSTWAYSRRTVRTDPAVEDFVDWVTAQARDDF